MQFHYEINVSLNGQHFFATAERSLTTRDKMQRVYAALNDRFPASEGFKISVTEWNAYGKSVDPTEMDDDNTPAFLRRQAD